MADVDSLRESAQEVFLFWKMSTPAPRRGQPSECGPASRPPNGPPSRRPNGFTGEVRLDLFLGSHERRFGQRVEICEPELLDRTNRHEPALLGHPSRNSSGGLRRALRVPGPPPLRAPSNSEPCDKVCTRASHGPGPGPVPGGARAGARARGPRPAPTRTWARLGRKCRDRPWVSRARRVSGADRPRTGSRTSTNRRPNRFAGRFRTGDRTGDRTGLRGISDRPPGNHEPTPGESGFLSTFGPQAMPKKWFFVD